MTKEIATTWDSGVNPTDMTTGGAILSSNVETFVPRNHRIYSRSGQLADGLYWPDGLSSALGTKPIVLYAVTSGELLADAFIADPTRLKGGARKITFNAYGKDCEIVITFTLFNSATTVTSVMALAGVTPDWFSHEVTVPANAQLVTMTIEPIDDGPAILYHLSWRETILVEADL